MHKVEYVVRRIKDFRYTIAMIGFKLMKSWIVAQFIHDADDVQVSEILNDVVEEALNEAGVTFERRDIPNTKMNYLIMK